MKNNYEKFKNGINNFTRKSIIKKGGYIALFSMIISTSSVVHAVENKDIQTNNKVQSSTLEQSKEKDGIHVIKSDLKEDQKYKYDTETSKEPKGDLKERVDFKGATNETVEVRSLLRLNYSDMVEKVKNMSFSSCNSFFVYNGDTRSFYSDKNRVQALIDAFNQSAKKYTKDNDEGIANLVEVIRAGFYLGYYNDTLSYLDETTYKDKCIEGMKSIESNEAFGFETETQMGVVSALGSLIGNGTVDSETINGTTPILKTFKENFDKFSVDKEKSGSLKQLLEGIQYYLQTLKYQKDVKTLDIYGTIDEYLNELSQICLIDNQRIDASNEFVVNNAITKFSEIGVYSKNRNEIVKVLEKIMNQYEYASFQYVEVASSIQDNYDGKDSNGNDINYEKIKEDAKNKILPKTYKFDDDKIVVKAGDKVAEEKIQRLYWASKEVKAQFLRMVQNDKPFQEGNADEVLTIVIYNSPAEYKLNTKLFGYDTNNGGMYIEPEGTFYTYERTPAESIYTLEELFRHEFTHYLQGRYLVPGMWGDGEFYRNHELTWFEEGTAEFFAGATRTEGIKPRSSVAGGISSERSQRMTVSQLVNSKYGSWDFYNYGWAFASYMYDNNMGAFNTMIRYIKSNNANAFRNYMRDLATDPTTNSNYQNYLDRVVKNLDNIGVPLVSDYYTSDTEYKDANEVYSEIGETAKLTKVETKEEKSQYFNTFDLKGVYEGSRSKGDSNDINDMNKKLDGVLNELSNKNWTGYETVTAYFLNHRVNQNGNYEYDVVFHGKLANDKSINKTVKANFNCSNTGIINKDIEFDASKSTCADGKITSYEWDFGDGQKQTTTDSKITHKYADQGDYKVTLKVTGDNSTTDENGCDIKILKHDPKTEISKEKEPNNEIYEANQILGSDVPMVASIGNKDSRDYYTFTVEKKGDVKINLENKEGLELNWLLFKEGNNTEFISYLGKNSENVIELEPGKYNISLYTLDAGKSGNYKLSVNGFLKDFDGEITTDTDDKTEDKTTDKTEDKTDDKTTDKTEDKTEDKTTDETHKKVEYIYEKEDNNTIEKASNIIGAGIPVIASLNSSDRDDYFKFTVTKKDKIKVEANKYSVNMNWVVYKEGDNYNYAMTPQTSKDVISGEKELEPGTYYVRAYYVGGNPQNSSYSIKLSGSIGELEQTK